LPESWVGKYRPCQGVSLKNDLPKSQVYLQIFKEQGMNETNYLDIKEQELIGSLEKDG